MIILFTEILIQPTKEMFCIEHFSFKHSGEELNVESR